MLERTRIKVRKAVSLALAAVMCAGMVPSAATDVSAANYSVHTVKDLIATAHEQESSDALLIVNTRNYSVTVNNKDFMLTKTPEEKTRTNISLSRDKVPVKEDETKTWQNVCQIKYEKVGYLPDGRWVDLTYNLDRITLTGTVGNDYNSAGSYLQVCAATIRGAQSGLSWYSTSDESVGARTPYASDHQWSVKVTASDGSRIESVKMPLLFKDIDVVNENNSGDAQTEGITLISGFASDTWVQNGSKLKITDGGARYDATAGSSETDDPAIYLAIKKEAGTVAHDAATPSIELTNSATSEAIAVSDGVAAANVTMTLAAPAADENSKPAYVYSYADDEYSYELNSAWEGNFNGVAFALTGAINTYDPTSASTVDGWADLANITPSVNVVWSIENPNDAAAEEIASIVSGDATVYIRLVAGMNADAEKITSVKVDGVTTDSFSVAGSGAIIVNNLAAGSHTFTIVYDGTTYTGTGTAN